MNNKEEAKKADQQKKYVMNVKETAKRLKKLRNEEKLSYNKLAEKLVSKYELKTTAESLTASLKKYEADECNSSYGSVGGMATNTLYMLADYYEVSVDYLLGLSELRSTNDDFKIVHSLTGLPDKAIEELGLWLERAKNTEETQYTYETYKKAFDILIYLIENELRNGLFIDLANFLYFKENNKEIIALNQPIINDDLSYTMTVKQWEALNKVQLDEKLYSIKKDIEEAEKDGEHTSKKK